MQIVGSLQLNNVFPRLHGHFSNTDLYFLFQFFPLTQICLILSKVILYVYFLGIALKELGWN